MRVDLPVCVPITQLLNVLQEYFQCALKEHATG
jgi:hypothetical protein